MHRTGTFLNRKTAGLPHHGANCISMHHLLGELGNWPHHINDVDNLKECLFTGLNRFLTGNNQHRHATQLGISGWRDEIGGARSQGRQTNTGFAG